MSDPILSGEFSDHDLSKLFGQYGGKSLTKKKRKAMEQWLKDYNINKGLVNLMLHGIVIWETKNNELCFTQTKNMEMLKNDNDG